MINRYRTQCKICEHHNTLRITLGTDTQQNHTFACANCGEPNIVTLKIDFKNRKSIPELAEEPFRISAPTVEFSCVENCDLSETEGTVTNLDPTFVVPEELLHQDFVFPWMYEMRKIGLINTPPPGSPKVSDVIWGLGGQRNLKELLSTIVRSHNLANRQQPDLSEKQLQEFRKIAGITDEIDFNSALLVIAEIFIGQSRLNEIGSLFDEIQLCADKSQREYFRFKQYVAANSSQFIDRLMHVINDYLQAYDQLFQVWIYVARKTPLSTDSVASSRDFKRVKMFYGNAFEELSAGLWIPACLNNIKCGRPYDQFKEMSLKQYLSINKANRANPIYDNPEFAILYDEFDSTIRNATHHGGIRLSSATPNTIEYRSGDNGGWKKMSYADYLIKCNQIMFCLMRLLAVQLAITRNS